MEYAFDSARNEPFKLRVVVVWSFHGPRLSASGLSVGKDGAIEASENSFDDR